MKPTLRITSYNIHKGLSFFNRRVVVHEVRDRLMAINADIVFLQEVQGHHARHMHRPDRGRCDRETMLNPCRCRRRPCMPREQHGFGTITRAASP